MCAERRRARKGQPRQPVPETRPDDLFDYADEPAPDGRERRRSPLRIVDMESLPVFDDWPEKVPITEAEHLSGDTDMVALIAAIIAEERRRKAEGRPDHQIPMRPDHGQDILDDLKRNAQPGYPSIGRLKGLAELRGIMTALEHAEFGLKPT